MGGGSRVPWEQLKDLKVFPLEKKRLWNLESYGRRD